MSLYFIFRRQKKILCFHLKSFEYAPGQSDRRTQESFRAKTTRFEIIISVEAGAKSLKNSSWTQNPILLLEILIDMFLPQFGVAGESTMIGR